MGNIDSNLRDDNESDSPLGQFIIHYISASDIPNSDFMTKFDPFLKSYISEYKTEGDKFNLIRTSDVVQTPRRQYSSSIVWNSYRDFYIHPSDGSFLTVELHDWTAEKKDNDPIGSVNIPIENFCDEVPKTFKFDLSKGNAKKSPNFSVTLARVYLNKYAPIQKTIFLLRHGESKWNKAQAKRNIGGLLDIDHALTEVGIHQAENLNKVWTDYRETEESTTREEESTRKQTELLMAVSESVDEDEDEKNDEVSVNQASVDANNDLDNSIHNKVKNATPFSQGASAEEQQTRFRASTVPVTASTSVSSALNPLAGSSPPVENFQFGIKRANSLRMSIFSSSGHDPSNPFAYMEEGSSLGQLHVVPPLPPPPSANTSPSLASVPAVTTTSSDGLMTSVNTDDAPLTCRSASSEESSTGKSLKPFAETKKRAHPVPTIAAEDSSSYSIGIADRSMITPDDSGVGIADRSMRESNDGFESTSNGDPDSCCSDAENDIGEENGNDGGVNDDGGEENEADEVEDGEDDDDDNDDDNDDEQSAENNDSKNGNAEEDLEDEATRQRMAEDQRSLDRRSMKLQSLFNSVSLNEIIERRKQYRQMFLKAEMAYCSPLTRAIQTAFVALEGHPALAKNGLTLYSVIREIKGVGGLDTVGTVFGDAIADRVHSELENILGRQRTEELMIDSLYPNDAATPWWTNIHSFDSKEDQRERMREFISFARYCEASLPIFIGHSLFFKQFYSRRVSKLLTQTRPELAENLKKFRLSNATVLAVTVLFGPRHDSEPQIIDADLIFGGGFDEGDEEAKGEHHHHHRHSRHPHGQKTSGTGIEDVLHDYDGAGGSGGGIGSSISSSGLRMLGPLTREVTDRAAAIAQAIQNHSQNTLLGSEKKPRKTSSSIAASISGLGKGVKNMAKKVLDL